MPSPRALPVALLLWSLTTASAQDGAAPRELQAMLAELGDPARAVRAIRRFVALGKPAVPVLVADVQARRAAPADDFRRLMALYALGKLRGHAAAAVQPLLDEVSDSDGLLQRQLIWALGEIGGAAAVPDERLLETVQAIATEPGWNRQEWHIARQKIRLGSQPHDADVVAWLNGEDFGEIVAAASVAATPAVPFSKALENALDKQFQRMLEVQAVGGGVERAVLDLARAIVLRSPDSPHRMDALAAWAHHFDPEQRLQAFEALAASARKEAVPPLVRALADSVPELRLEAITALGILGPVATGAIDELERLAADADRQVATRARASLRAIRRAQ